MKGTLKIEKDGREVEIVTELIPSNCTREELKFALLGLVYCAMDAYSEKKLGVKTNYVKRFKKEAQDGLRIS